MSNQDARARSNQDARAGSRILLPLTIAYGAASLFHFAHNAVFLQDYPNLPSWLTAGGVWAAWSAIAALGALGYFIYRRVSRPTGLLVLALYALLGFGGLDHYAVAPFSAHSLAMNATIVVEVMAATALLAAVCHELLRRPHLRPPVASSGSRAS